MAQSILEKQQDGSVKLDITIPKEKVQKARSEVMETLTKQANVAGFRKGKAPQTLVEDKLKQEQVQEEILKKVLPEAYVEAVQEHNLRPIMNPKIHVGKLDEGADWKFTAITTEMPDVQLGDYKNKVKAITAKSKIALPGKEQAEPDFDEIMKAVVEGTTVQIPQVLIDQEVDRLLAQVLDDIKKLGLTLDQYLSSTKRSPEDLRAEYAKRAEQDIKVEFILQKIAETEKITVEDKEVDEAIEKAKDPTEREQLSANKYLLA
ncbi:MAG: hypothetical protein KGH54_04500, partial [Candidatus Micrarchaeota archaeon]|nr:hypothetical protein [Candidatus Micrarchaeota archaeon]